MICSTRLGHTAQGFGGELVDKIEGSFSNVVRLSIKEVMVVLKDFGLEIKEAR